MFKICEDPHYMMSTIMATAKSTVRLGYRHGIPLGDGTHREKRSLMTRMSCLISAQTRQDQGVTVEKNSECEKWTAGLSACLSTVSDRLTLRIRCAADSEALSLPAYPPPNILYWFTRGGASDACEKPRLRCSLHTGSFAYVHRDAKNIARAVNTSLGLDPSASVLDCLSAP